METRKGQFRRSSAQRHRFARLHGDRTGDLSGADGRRVDARRGRLDDIADFLGHPLSLLADPRQALTHRERDVYDLLIQGLKNREIAQLLFIEESTVKVHAHHIYDKLGIRSRTALTIHAMLARSDQATSATDSTSSSADSG